MNLKDNQSRGAKLNPVTQLWELALSESDEVIARPVTRIFQLSAVNSSGYAIRQDEINGEDEKRTRQLGFCLLHPPRALCGAGVVGLLADGPKGDMTTIMLELLSTIEFVEQPGDALPVPPPPPPPSIVVPPCMAGQSGEQGFCR